ncbi:CheR family methyltransferase [Limnoraphis robusta]|uniref:histidine kinase n=1 Tax=Limnoraphis robusta CCNP1315 TaxID=3110306 RepID=A0ABU5U0A2_9CYAN|nr:CheR family methyltransferase [Limnoraphis robusta]MEA5520574.1 CheR family methyltransferase [Limnoraphis robusta CCNP1315]MEA5547228.1 CheR family methyltransferase [Limnoraphis robusta CCNP1324]
MSNTSDQEENFYIVAIGASAGGVQALQTFFANLSNSPNAAFVVILHHPPDSGHQLSEILQRQTSLPVNVIENESTIDKNNVYVQPPHTYLNIRDHRLYLSDFPTEGLPLPITHFFQSLALEYNERAIGILLSGSGSDGAEGLKNISRAGGIALVQCPESAQFQGMPNSAITSGLVDEILSPVELAEVVYDITHLGGHERISPQAPNLITTEQLGQILNILATKQQTDFSQYKTTTLHRRIGHRFALSRLGSIDSYIRFLAKNNEEQQKLCQDILIGATRFFRDPSAWKIISEDVLPKLINELTAEDQLRIWVSACATGEEAYTMAILVNEAIRNSEKAINYKIFATDLDTQALEVASRGIYPEAIANDISAERLERYFTYDNSCFRVKRSLREMLIFSPHDLTTNPGFSQMSLISCRNVLIYMQPQLQQRVLQLLHFSLKPQGVLFLGDTESLGELDQEFMLINTQWKIYSKRRDVKLSLTQLVTRQPAIVRTSMNSILPNKSNTPRFEQLLEEIFKQSFESRLITCVLVNRENRLIHVFYNTADLLEISLGEADLEISKIIHPDLKLPLATSLHRAKRNQEPVLYNGIKINRNDQSEMVRLKIGHNPNLESLEDCFIVFLEIENPTIQSQQLPEIRYEIESEAAQRIVELEHELQQTRENLQAVVEELETFNEEQQAMNEELLASNEELQSTNEELQSANEELYTVNSEYQSKIEQLTRLTDDVDNLLRSTDIGVLFLDLNLKICRLTPAATQAINIRPTDINRSIFDFTNNLDCPNLMELLQQVIETQQPLEREVTLLTTGEHLLMRIHCYLREDNSCDGVVLTFVNINDIKIIQQRLEHTNNRLENLYESSPVGLFLIDDQFRFLRVNSVLAEMNNCSVEEHLGKTVSEVTPQFSEQFLPFFRQVIETGKPVKNVEIEGTKPSEPDTKGYYLATYYPLQMNDGEQAIGGIIVDISAEKKAQKELEESRNLIEQITESSPGIIYIFDLAEQTISYINRGVSENLGYHPDDIKQKGIDFFSEIVHPDDLDQVKQHYKQFENRANQQPIELEYRMRHKDGSWHWFMSREVVFRRTETGEPKDMLGINTDINDRKKAELELAQLNQTLEQRVKDRTCELEEAKQKAEEANTSKSQFLSWVTHELRTPLNIIMGFAQLLGRCENLNSKQQQHVDLIYNNGQQLVKLINELLDLGKIEANRMELELEWFDLYPLMNEVEEMFQLEIERKGLELSVEIDSGVPPYIQTDEQKLRQVLVNLITNAIKFTNAGGVSVRVNMESTSSSDTEQTMSLRFEVEDTGRGIPPEELEHLFEAFVQGEAGRTSRLGTGLGLAICRQFIEMMGGEIRVNSTVGEGTTVDFSIAINFPVEVVSSIQQGQQIIGLTPDEPPYRILIVDDRVDNRQLLRFMLGSLGFETLEAENGLEAISQFEQHQPQLILMDIKMPVMNGLEAIQRIKTTPEGEATVMIAVLASALNDSQEEMLNNCCDDMIFKPIREEVLLNKIAECLGVRYVYASEATESPADNNKQQELRLAIEKLNQMSNEWRSQVSNAAIACDLQKVLQLLEEIPEAQLSLKELLNRLADEYQFDAIAQLFNPENPPI